MCENAYLSIKNPKASRALKRALDPGRRMLASLARLRFAMSATFGLKSWAPPLDQILDPHLLNRQFQCQSSLNFCKISGKRAHLRNKKIENLRLQSKNTLTSFNKNLTRIRRRPRILSGGGDGGGGSQTLRERGINMQFCIQARSHGAILSECECVFLMGCVDVYETVHMLRL